MNKRAQETQPDGSRVIVAAIDLDGPPPTKRSRSETPPRRRIDIGALPTEILWTCANHMPLHTLVAFSNTIRAHRALYADIFASQAFSVRLNRYIDAECSLGGLIQFARHFATAYAARTDGAGYLRDQYAVHHVTMGALCDRDESTSFVAVTRFERDEHAGAPFKASHTIHLYEPATLAHVDVLQMSVTLDLGTHALFARPHIEYFYEEGLRERFKTYARWPAHHAVLLRGFLVYVNRYPTFTLYNVKTSRNGVRYVPFMLAEDDLVQEPVCHEGDHQRGKLPVADAEKAHRRVETYASIANVSVGRRVAVQYGPPPTRKHGWAVSRTAL